MGNRLIVNQEALAQASRTYHTAASDMTIVCTDLEKALADLRQKWKSTGSQEFFKEFDDTWKTNMSKYTSVIHHMSENVVDANHRYQEIFDEAYRLRL